MSLITIKVNKETIESGNTELLMCEAKDYLEKENMIDILGYKMLVK